MTLYTHMYQNVCCNLLQKNFSILERPLYKCLLLEKNSQCFFMFGAILKATNNSFQQGITLCRSIYVMKVMKILAFIFNSPRSFLIFQEVWTSMAKGPYSFVILQGQGGWGPDPGPIPLWIRACIVGLDSSVSFFGAMDCYVICGLF